MTTLIDRLKPVPHQPEIADRAVVDKTYAHWRLRVFYSMYVGYALYYLTRKSFTFAMPSLIQDFGFDKGQLGLLATIFSVTYGISKFFSGLISDRSNPRYFMAIGLMCTGAINIAFGLASSLYVFAAFWGLNGWFQGCGWPACARLLTHWYSQSERGRWWSIWNTSQHIGGAIVPLFTAYCVQMYGWRSAMILPGIFVILGSFFLINRLCDTPQSLGLPPIEKYRSDYPTIGATEQERELSSKEILFNHVLNNPIIWILGVSYLFVYMIRMAVNDWTAVYLVEAKGYSQLGAGAVVFWYEIGGVLGSLAAGWFSDKIFSGNRGPINGLFCLVAVFATYLFWTTPGNMPVIDSVLVFSLGFLIFGPQMLIGVAAAELSHKKAAGSATGFIGWIAYIGSAMAGFPLGKIIQNYGWEGYFYTLTASAAIAAILLLPLWHVQAARQKALAKQPVEND